ncbi:MAG: NUDIX hydrolase [Planctomycetota bacterium]|nr:MAG: NUDIX hydrolase [Planctomycetota bacterium]
MLGDWQEIERQNEGSFRIFDVWRVQSRSPRTGEAHEFYTLDCRDWVNVLAWTEEERLVLVRQFRHGPEEFTLEIPGGAVDPGEDLLEAGLRELREESGYVAGEAKLLGAVNPNPAIFGNSCGTVLATGCRPEGELILDAGEDIQVMTLTPAEVRQAMRAGQVNHALVFAAFLWGELEGAPSLFGF